MSKGANRAMKFLLINKDMGGTVPHVDRFTGCSCDIAEIALEWEIHFQYDRLWPHEQSVSALKFLYSVLLFGLSSYGILSVCQAVATWFFSLSQLFEGSNSSWETQSAVIHHGADIGCILFSIKDSEFFGSAVLFQRVPNCQSQSCVLQHASNVDNVITTMHYDNSVCQASPLWQVIQVIICIRMPYTSICKIEGPKWVFQLTKARQTFTDQATAYTIFPGFSARVLFRPYTVCPGEHSNTIVPELTVVRNFLLDRMQNIQNSSFRYYCSLCYFLCLYEVMVVVVFSVFSIPWYVCKHLLAFELLQQQLHHSSDYIDAGGATREILLGELAVLSEAVDYFSNENKAQATLASEKSIFRVRSIFWQVIDTRMSSRLVKLKGCVRAVYYFAITIERIAGTSFFSILILVIIHIVIVLMWLSNTLSSGLLVKYPKVHPPDVLRLHNALPEGSSTAVPTLAPQLVHWLVSQFFSILQEQVWQQDVFSMELVSLLGYANSVESTLLHVTRMHKGDFIETALVFPLLNLVMITLSGSMATHLWHSAWDVFRARLYFIGGPDICTIFVFTVILLLVTLGHLVALLWLIAWVIAHIMDMCHLFYDFSGCVPYLLSSSYNEGSDNCIFPTACTSPWPFVGCCIEIPWVYTHILKREFKSGAFVVLSVTINSSGTMTSLWMVSVLLLLQSCSMPFFIFGINILSCIWGFRGGTDACFRPQCPSTNCFLLRTFENSIGSAERPISLPSQQIITSIQFLHLSTKTDDFFICTSFCYITCHGFSGVFTNTTSQNCGQSFYPPTQQLNFLDIDPISISVFY